jgi:hypothetical protein
MNTPVPLNAESTKTKQMSCPFSENLEVYYDDRLGKRVYGYIRFVSSEYVTVCIKEGPDKVNHVCLLFYPNQWDQLVPTVSKRNQ